MRKTTLTLISTVSAIAVLTGCGARAASTDPAVGPLQLRRRAAPFSS